LKLLIQTRRIARPLCNSRASCLNIDALYKFTLSIYLSKMRIFIRINITRSNIRTFCLRTSAFYPGHTLMLPTLHPHQCIVYTVPAGSYAHSACLCSCCHAANNTGEVWTRPLSPQSLPASTRRHQLYVDCTDQGIAQILAQENLVFRLTALENMQN